VRNALVGILTALALAAAANVRAQDQNGQIQWTRNGAPATVAITGGPWTLEQSGAANGLKSAGYCDSNGIQIRNPGTERMEPYYFPEVLAKGNNYKAISTGGRRTLTKL
jgi:hypothetical protein